MIEKLQKMYTPDYLLYLLTEEIDISEYSLYNHKATKKILNGIISKYIDDYTVSVRENSWGNKELSVTIYDRFYMDDPEDMSISVTLLSY